MVCKQEFKFTQMQDKIVTIFDPRKATDYKSAYPELSRISEFKKISSDELKVAWYYANPTSPFANISDDDERLKLAVEEVYKSDTTKKEQFLNGEYSSNFTAAAMRMSKINATYRKRAYEIINIMIDEFQEIVEKGREGFSTTKVTESGAITEIDYAKFVTTMKMIRSELPQIIEQAEEGFATKPKDKEKSEEGQNYMTDYHKSKTDKIK